MFYLSLPDVDTEANLKQTASWIFSIMETVVKVVFALVYFALYRKTKGVDAKLRLADTLGGEVSGLLSSAI
jgi:hypothetical protein